MKKGRTGKTRIEAPRDRKTEVPASRHVYPSGTPSAFATLVNSQGFATALIFLAVLVFYLPALRGGFIWDDNDYVTGNPLLKIPGGLSEIWCKIGATPQYYPLVFTTFWLECHLWGLQPFGYHLVNVLLHAGSAVLLWTALRRLGVCGAWLAGLVFALHPVAVESVAWITERKNVLSTFFYLLSFLALLRFYRLDEPEATSEDGSDPARSAAGWNWPAYLLALVLFACALLSKTVTCTLPVAVLIVLWWKRGRVRGGDLLRLVPFFVVGAALGLLTAWMEKHIVGAKGIDWTLSPLDRCLLAGRVIWFYLAKLFWPVGLTFIYPRWEVNPGSGWQYLFPLGVGALLLALWLLRRRIGRGPLAAALFFTVTLAPALGFIDVYPMRYSFVADHFQYLAMIGPITLAAALGAVALERLAAAERPFGQAGLGILLVALGALTWCQGYHYKDLPTLWRSNIEGNPKSWLALNNLGILLEEQGRKQEAFDLYQRAVQANPRYSDSHSNLANLLGERNRPEEALAHCREALRLSPEDPHILYNMGNLLVQTNQLDPAIEDYGKALKIKPDYLEAHFNLANVLVVRGRTAEAYEHLRRALELDSSQVAAAVRMAWLLATVPDPRFRNGSEAVRLAESACQATNGQDAQALDALAAAYAEINRFDGATLAAQRALEAAERVKDEQSIQAIRSRLQLYQSQRPYREDPAASAKP